MGGGGGGGGAEAPHAAPPAAPIYALVFSTKRGYNYGSIHFYKFLQTGLFLINTFHRYVCSKKNFASNFYIILFCYQNEVTDRSRSIV